MTGSVLLSRSPSDLCSRRVPPARLGLVAVAASLALAGCAGSGGGSGDAGATSSPASSSAPSSSESASAQDLTPGLLPADAFGAGATVTSITAQQLQQGSAAGPMAGGALKGATITPEACAAAVKSTQPPAGDLPGLAAQAATDPSTGTATVEVLAEGDGVTDAVSQVADQIAACPQATITSPQFTATITFEPLDVPDLGDGSAGISFTTTAQTAGGQQVTVPALVGLVADGDRLLALTTVSQQAAPDPAAFTALLQKAYETQADALD
jgi:hypothetical protein